MLKDLHLRAHQFSLRKKTICMLQVTTASAMSANAVINSSSTSSNSAMKKSQVVIVRRVLRRLSEKVSLPVFFVFGTFAGLYKTCDRILKEVVEGEEGVLGKRAYERRERLSVYAFTNEQHRLFLFVTSSLALGLYVASVLCDPGRVPENWVPDVPDCEATGRRGFLEVKRKGKGLKRFCQKCNGYKPPRAHHCRVCQRCVLRMDHHCVWINNCVGHKNYKAFFLFLFYATIAVAHCAVLLASHVVMNENKPTEASSSTSSSSTSSWDWNAISEISALMISFPLLLAISLLFAWHVWLTSKNCTTIEHYEGVRSKVVEPKIGDAQNNSNNNSKNDINMKKIEHPYSLGLSGNLREVLGAKVRYWFIPGCSIDGDGLSYANAYENSDKWRSKVNQELEL